MIENKRKPIKTPEKNKNWKLPVKSKKFTGSLIFFALSLRLFIGKKICFLLELKNYDKH